MNERADRITASCVDLAIILLPMIGGAEAARMMLASGVPPPVIDRVIKSPAERRAIQELNISGAAV